MNRLEIAETVIATEMLTGIKLLLNEGSGPAEIAKTVEEMHPVISQIVYAAVQYGADKDIEDFTTAIENMDIWKDKEA